MNDYPHFAVRIDGQAFCFETGYRLVGVSLQVTSDGWSLTLRADDPGGNPVYCRTVGDDPGEMARSLYRSLTNRGGNQLWNRDKFRGR